MANSELIKKEIKNRKFHITDWNNMNLNIGDIVIFPRITYCIVVGIDNAGYIPENKNEKKWFDADYQIEYWKKNYGFTIDKPKFIISVVHISGLPIFRFPDTVILDVIPNKIIKKLKFFDDINDRLEYIECSYNSIDNMDVNKVGKNIVEIKKMLDKMI